MLYLFLISLIENIHVNDKLFLTFVLIMMLFDIILCIIELVYYSKTSCGDGQNHGFVYIDFIFAFVGKLVVFNFINLEISCSLPFDNLFPYFYPIVLFGMFPAMQMPQFVYDYIQCRYRSPMFDLVAAYGLTEFIGISLLVIGGGGCIITLCFNDLLNMKNRVVNWSKFLVVSYMKLFAIILNFITLLMTFSQVDHFLPALFIENICFWFLLIVAVYLKFCGNATKNYESMKKSSSSFNEENKGLRNDHNENIENKDKNNKENQNDLENDKP